MLCNRKLKQEVKISLSFPLKVNFAEKNVIYKCILSLLTLKVVMSNSFR